MVKNILIGVVVVLALLVGAVVIAPSFIDSAAIKDEITEQVRTATGRELSIGGNLEVRLLPAPSLIANDVRLSNAKGGQAKDMVVMKAVEVRIALMPLLSGQVQVERIRLVAPVVSIEKFADGRTNLDFKPAPQIKSITPSQGSTSQGATVGASGGASGLDIRLDSFEIVDGRLIYRDGVNGTVERIENIDATLRAGSLNGPFEAQGQARLRGVPLAFEISLGQIIEQRTMPVNAVLNAPGGAKAQLNGAVFGLGAKPRFKGKIKAEGENLAQLLDAVVGAGTAPVVLQQTFALDGQIEASAENVDLSELEVHLGKDRITGTIKVALSDGVNFDVQLKAARIDVDSILNTAGRRSTPSSTPASAADQGAQGGKTAQSTITPTPPEIQTSTVTAKEAFAFPKGVRGTVQVVVDAVTLKGGLVSDVRLAAELTDGELVLSQLQAMAPGVTDVAVFGFVRPRDGVPRFEGNVEVTSDDLTGLTNWLGVEVPAGIAGRVKRVTYKSQVAADATQVVVSSLEVTADHSKLTGGITLALRKRLSFGADLSLDVINIDTYSNGNAIGVVKASSGVERAATPQSETTNPAQMPSVLQAAGAWVALSALNDFDANLKVRVGRLVHQGKAYKKLAIDGTLYAGELQLRSLKLGDFQGASATLSGTFNGFGAIPEISKVKIDAKVKNGAKLANALGLEGVPAGLKAVTLQGAAQGSLLKPRFSVTVDALDGQISGQGRFSLLPIGFGYDGHITAKHGNVAALLKALDLDYKPAGPLGALDLSARLNTDGKTHKITGLKSTLGETAINGDITARTTGAKPRVIADLQTGVLVLDRFLPKQQKNAALRKPGTRFGKRPDVSNIIYASFGDDQLAQAGTGAGADKRWSRERFDLSVLNMLDGDITLKSDAIQFGDYKLSAADIHATVQNGVLNADKITGNLFGGPIRGTAIVRADGSPTIESNFKLDTLLIDQAVKAVTGKKLASGNLSLNLDVNATGMSPAEMVSSLAGNGNLNINDLDVKKGGKGSALSGVIGLVAAMNQLSLGTKKKGKGLADLALDFDIRDGIANASKMTLSSSMGNGTGSGKIDIAGWDIDIVGNMTVEANLLTTLLSKGRVGRQEIPFSLKGALDNPGIKLGVRKASTGGSGGAPSIAVPQKFDPFRSLIEKALPGLKLEQIKPSQPPQQANP
ncbi:MAG: AsmA family protein, partial [Magnetovibrio sp.]|nr:AsmA family protein [Magnetovibrio sp.]